MNTELLGIVATYLLTLVIAIPLGKYLAKVFAKKAGRESTIETIISVKKNQIENKAGRN